MKKVAVLIPSYSTVPVEFFWSVIRLFQGNKNYSLDFYGGYCCFLAQSRNKCAKEALDKKPDYILWLDADQTYPENTIDILTAHIDSGKSVVGGLTLKRGNKRPMVFMYMEETGHKLGQAVMVNGLTKCDGMGMGGVMMTPEVLKKLDFPYFNTFYEGDKHVADDSYFYRKCKDAGIDVWCDGDLKYGHLTMMEMK